MKNQLRFFCEHFWVNKSLSMMMMCVRSCELGSVAGPVIQATGRSDFEDGLGSGDFWPVHLVWMTARHQQDTFLSWHLAQASEVGGGHTLPF
jgi:hypothetical protein